MSYKLYLLTGILLFGFMMFSCTSRPTYREISWEKYLDKVEGGWLGQMIGVAFGDQSEFKWQGRIIPFDFTDYLRLKDEAYQAYRAVETAKEKYLIIEDKNNWQKWELDGALDQDDTYIELMFLHGIKTHGIEVTARQLAEIWLKYMDYDRVWHANKAAHTNFMNGIWPPDSGRPEHNEHANDIDFQIEADLFGLICPGLPQESNKWSDKVGHLMNYGDGVYGGMFVAGMYTAAFFETNPVKIIRWGLKCIHPQSDYAKLIRDILDSYEQDKTWQGAWQMLEDKWGGTDTCPDGRGNLFNIDAKMNGGYIAIGLLWGEGDLWQTMNISTRCGQDSDCNPSNAAGIIGCVLGASGIAEKWKAPMKDFVHNYSMREIYPDRINRADVVQETAEIGRNVVEAAGGEVLDICGKKVLRIPYQEPQPPAQLEVAKWD